MRAYFIYKEFELNNINSLILEGIASECKLTDSVNGKVAEFNLKVARHYKRANGEWQDEFSDFPCVATNSMAERASKEIYEERDVRVVGRLKVIRFTDEIGKLHSKIVVICEYIEYKYTPDTVSVAEPTEF